MAHPFAYRAAMPKTALEYLAENLIRLRDSSPLPKGQRSFQARTGVAETTLGRFRRAQGNPTLRQLMLIGNAYKVSDTWRLIAPNLGMKTPAEPVDTSAVIKSTVSELGRDVPQPIKNQVRELLTAWFALPGWEMTAYKDEIVAASKKHLASMERDKKTSGKVVSMRKKQHQKKADDDDGKDKGEK